MNKAVWSIGNMVGVWSKAHLGGANNAVQILLLCVISLPAEQQRLTHPLMVHDTQQNSSQRRCSGCGLAGNRRATASEIKTISKPHGFYIFYNRPHIYISQCDKMTFSHHLEWRCLISGFKWNIILMAFFLLRNQRINKVKIKFWFLPPRFTLNSFPYITN